MENKKECGNQEISRDPRATGFSSEIGTKLRDWAVGQAGAAATLGQHCPQMTQRPGSIISNMISSTCYRSYQRHCWTCWRQAAQISFTPAALSSRSETFGGGCPLPPRTPPPLSSRRLTRFPPTLHSSCCGPPPSPSSVIATSWWRVQPNNFRRYYSI